MLWVRSPESGRVKMQERLGYEREQNPKGQGFFSKGYQASSFCSNFGFRKTTPTIGTST